MGFYIFSFPYELSYIVLCSGVWFVIYCVSSAKQVLIVVVVHI